MLWETSLQAPLRFTFYLYNIHKMNTNERSETSEEPLILVCNDDGIDAPGIYALASAMDELGDVFVVAPIDEQSAVGHAITVRDPVRARPWRFAVPSGSGCRSCLRQWPARVRRNCPSPLAMPAAWVPAVYC